jgi:hypothetical protein
MVVVYAAKMKNGKFRCVGATSWRDAKRHLGSAALSIKRRVVSRDEQYEASYSEELRREIFERE